MRNLFLMLFTILISYVSKSQIVFNEAIGGNATDQAIFARQTLDGGYIVVGWTTSFGAGGWDIYLVKTNAVGVMMWTKTYGGPGDEIDCSVQQTTDKGYIITARTNSFGEGSSDVYLIKTDSLGSEKWTKTFGGTSGEEGHNVQQTKDRGYIHTGFTTSFGAGNADLYLIKNDSNGVIEWAKTFGGSGNDRGHFIHQTKDKGYIVIGETTSFGSGNWDFYVIKTDSMGTALWTKVYGGAGDDFGWDVQATHDGGYILGGWTGSFGAGGLDYYLIKTDSLGSVSWSRTYGGISDDNGYAIQQTTDGGYIIGGETTSFGVSSTDSADVYMVKTDSIGNLLWSKTFGGYGDDGCQSVQQTTDGGYVLSGYTNSFSAGNWDFYLIKTDIYGNSNSCYESSPVTISNSAATVSYSVTGMTGSGGIEHTVISQVSSGGIVSFCSSTGIKETTESRNEINLYPNPTYGIINLQSTKTLGAITISNTLGEILINTKSKNTSEQFDLSYMPKGVYILTTQGISHKIVLE